MQKRSLVAMILLTLITFGIYGIYWYCSFQNQLKKNTGMGFGGVGHFFVSIITFGIYGLYWSFAVGKRIEALGGKNNGIIYLILTLIGFGWVANLLMQNEVNQLN
ncbi:MAG: DUF4234 domain-containing protein [Clostridia bacterium]